jgi:APA family basic amino acid/polyamine antiporter
VFLVVTGWTLVYILMERPVEGLWGLTIVGSGGVFYVLTRWIGKLHAPAQQ